MRNSLIAVPTYNEAENVAAVVEQIARAVPEAHLVIVDDNSPDGTADIASKLFKSDERYRNYSVLRRTGPRGLGRAYRDAFAMGLDRGYDRVVQMDADLSHDPAYLPALFAAAVVSDVVIGSRYCPGGGVRDWPRSRVLLSRFANLYVRTVAHIPIADSTAGFRCWSRRSLLAMELESFVSEGYCFQVELSYRAHRAGMRIVEVPITFTDRKFGRSKISRAVLIESFLMPWRLRAHPWRPRAAAGFVTAASDSHADSVSK